MTGKDNGKCSLFRSSFFSNAPQLAGILFVGSRPPNEYQRLCRKGEHQENTGNCVDAGAEEVSTVAKGVSRENVSGGAGVRESGREILDEGIQIVPWCSYCCASESCSPQHLIQKSKIGWPVHNPTTNFVSDAPTRRSPDPDLAWGWAEAFFRSKGVSCT
jgi:hypothetical protein